MKRPIICPHCGMNVVGAPLELDPHCPLCFRVLLPEDGADLDQGEGNLPRYCALMAPAAREMRDKPPAQ